ncbi:MAG: ATP-dependent Clp protease ATP-binding subunit ClpA, partial [Leptospiraceae bacterium]|nr:ATP-dependent Clp protease ATP-binding subunit ClpA [Leptospiraceae bacterium]
MIRELETRLKSKKIELVLEDSARRYLAEKGFDRNYDARPIRRLIETEISHVLSNEILFGRLAGGGSVRISAGDEGLKFNF